MRPRIRTIKPELWRDQRLQGRPMHERLLFIGLFSHADDEGRIEGDPALLRSTIFPRDEITAKKLNDWLGGLEDHGFIQRYTAAGEPYIQVTNFPRHQKVDRPSPSSIPAYTDRDGIVIGS